jgi:8-oxo-dGTP pyrophosphatase MutT (NUDIX family)
MLREISSGGVVLRRRGRSWGIAVIEPQREAVAGKKETMLLALPKGLVDPGETAEQTALREVREETGLTASVIAKLADIKYVYVRSWGDKQRVFKIVSFYLLRYKSGRIDDVSSAMRVEVKRARWLALDRAAHELSYRGERDVVQKAQDYLRSHPNP